MLSELSTAGVLVDRCPDCGGLWIDWFDGEISQIATRARNLAQPAPLLRDGSNCCPDCRSALSAARYPDAEGGAEVLRCGACAGAFVPRGSLELVIALGPPRDDTEQAPSRLTLLWNELRRRFGG